MSFTLGNLTSDPSQTLFFRQGRRPPPAPEMHPETMAYSQSSSGIPPTPVIGWRTGTWPQLVQSDWAFCKLRTAASWLIQSPWRTLPSSFPCACDSELTSSCCGWPLGRAGIDLRTGCPQVIFSGFSQMESSTRSHISSNLHSNLIFIEIPFL